MRQEAQVHEVHIELQSGPTALIEADAVQLQQVVMNLGLNAIEAALESSERSVIIGTRVGDRDVEIFVRNTGRELSVDVANHMFEAFFSEKPNGLGMGLAIVRSVLERHGGTVHAANEPGGVVLRVLLPRPGGS